MTVAEIDLQVGGKWRYVMVADGGIEVGFHGEYREIVPNERIVSTEVFEGDARRGSGEHDDAHRGGRAYNVTILVQHASKEHRDAYIESGMEAGMQDALDSLEQVAISPLRGACGTGHREGLRWPRAFSAAVPVEGSGPQRPGRLRFARVALRGQHRPAGRTPSARRKA